MMLTLHVLLARSVVAWIAVQGSVRSRVKPLAVTSQLNLPSFNATAILENAVREATGDDEYRFGDLTKRTVYDLTGKDAADCACDAKSDRRADTLLNLHLHARLPFDSRRLSPTLAPPTLAADSRLSQISLATSRESSQPTRNLSSRPLSAISQAKRATNSATCRASSSTMQIVRWRLRATSTLMTFPQCCGDNCSKS